jgi:hypothetical protein
MPSEGGMTPPRPPIEAVSNTGCGSYPGQCGFHEPAGMYAAGIYAADWGVAEAPHKPVKRATGAGDRGARRTGPYMRPEAWKERPPFMNKPALPSDYE